MPSIDLTLLVKRYVEEMLDKVTGLRILLLDDETMSIVSSSISQTDILSHETYLTDLISNSSRDKLRHLKCVCFIRPTLKSIRYLAAELRNPLYGEYHIIFSNVISKTDIEVLAEADQLELVKSVFEFFADFIPIDPQLYILPPNCSPLYMYEGINNTQQVWNNEALSRCSTGLSSLLLACKKKPKIRYESNSPLARKLACEVQFIMDTESSSSLFKFSSSSNTPILIILDRKNDPVTPLLTQWTYQAMTHELVGINNGIVTLPNFQKNKPQKIVLSSNQDSFFKENMYLNFGDLGSNVKDFVNQFQSRNKTQTNIQSIDDMRRFIEDFPEFRALKENVSKHVSLISELSQIVQKNHLLEVSEVEQSLACHSSHNQDLKDIERLIELDISEITKIRLVCLYALRYESSSRNSLTHLKQLLIQNNVSIENVSMIEKVLHYGGLKQRLGNIFVDETIFSKAREGLRGLTGVENVYTQHKPYLETIIDQVMRQRLSDKDYPYIESANSTTRPPQDIFVFYVGGITFEETKACHDIMQRSPEVNIICGGTSVLNSMEFLRQVQISK